MTLHLRLQVRNESAADYKAVRDVHRLAFSADGESQLVDALREAGESLISLVAERQGQVIGHVLFSRIDAPMRALALGPVGVCPEHQKQGIGSALIRSGLEQAKQKSWDAVFVLGEPAYYHRFGFDAVAARGYDCVYAGEHFMMLTFRPALPKTGRLVYPAPWAALERAA